MSISHKAFALDFTAFERDLAPLLDACLRDDDPEPLIAFIEANRQLLVDPYEGEPLPANWRSLIDVGDVQEYADFALTRYYDPGDDFGLADDWDSETLAEDIQSALLGQPFGEGNLRFDPGRMGSFFQNAHQAQHSLVTLKHAGGKHLEGFIQGLEAAVRAGRGLYVTF